MIEATGTENATYFSYPSGNALYNKTMGYVGELVKFTGTRSNGIDVQVGHITKRILELAIPPRGTPAQIDQIQRAISDAAGKGVEIIIRIVQ